MYGWLFIIVSQLNRLISSGMALMSAVDYNEPPRSQVDILPRSHRPYQTRVAGQVVLRCERRPAVNEMCRHERVYTIDPLHTCDAAHLPV